MSFRVENLDIIKSIEDMIFERLAADKINLKKNINDYEIQLNGLWSNVIEDV